jgi:D-glycero-alpha-D-manno-heptose-7-phosphate kinase
MIITRSPLRISLGGGGTDLPSYSNEHGGALISAAINKYVYVAVNRPFQEGIVLKYSAIEKIKQINEISHPIIREALATLDISTPQLDITSISDIASGTGLGSSGSFTTALLKALYLHYRKVLHPKELAELACQIEIEKLNEPVGKQDQYIAAYGGITEFIFHKNGSVSSSPLALSVNTVHDLEDNLVLFFTGISRSASSILEDQDKKSQAKSAEMIENLHFTKDLGLRSKEALLNNQTLKFGELLHEHWEHKKSRSTSISNELIDEAYDLGMKSGAVGGKLVGAGGGGFLMFYAKDKELLRHKMTGIGMEEVRFQFDFEGTKVLHS